MTTISFDSYDSNSRPSVARCSICRSIITDKHNEPFCSEHKRVYDTRQQEKVSTRDLTPDWRDNLYAWREKPATLLHEDFSSKLLYTTAWHDWILFWMLYPNRLPDWLAVHRLRNEVRRFVEVSFRDVQTSLAKQITAPLQDFLRVRWGRARSWLVKSHGKTTLWNTFFETVSAGVSPGISIGVLFDIVPFPVFGLHNNSLSLALHAVDVSHQNGDSAAVNLTFAERRQSIPRGVQVAPKRILAVTSTLAPNRRESVHRSADPKQNDGMQLTLPTVVNAKLEESLRQLWQPWFDQFPLSFASLEGIEPTEAQVYSGSLLIDSVLFRGEMIHWPQRNFASVFFLRQAPTEGVSQCLCLYGHAMEIPAQELLIILGGMSAVNDSPKLLQRYRLELNDASHS